MCRGRGGAIVWFDTSCASYSHILRASVHQKIHEQDVVFGKVLGFELMILKCLSRQPIWYCNNIYNQMLRYHVPNFVLETGVTKKYILTKVINMILQIKELKCL